MSSEPILNIAFYRFAKLASPAVKRSKIQGDNPEGDSYCFDDALESLRARLRARCVGLSLRGTVILSPEGINAFLAGTRSTLESLIQILESEPLADGSFPFKDLDIKWSESDFVPFTVMRFKLKAEIIPFGLPEIDPNQSTGKRLDPKELKAWFDEGKEFLLLDTRNDYEIAQGTFKGAETLPIHHFRDFPKLFEEWKAKNPKLSESEQPPVVMFCTGGIRCEKATAFGMQKGLKDVYQLEGGILRYFEKVGGDHYDGNCFVFDHRIAVDSKLAPAPKAELAPCDPYSKDFLSSQKKLG